MNLLELGDKIKNLRKEKNITQKELANISNISRATLSKLENGRISEVSIVTLNTILNHLGYTLDIKASNPFATD
ncbi:MAG: helix-turn-helix domain-containing protein [Campylobacteraceae bacterium]|nr:helix-turn-helix domain-containing protein [Campylobacteraceae bacterium]